MDWVVLGVVAVFINVASSQSIGRPCAYPGFAPGLIPTITPTTAPTVVDGNVVQSLIDTIQLFIVSDLLEETLPEKQKIVSPVVYDVGYEIKCDDDCDIFPYEFVFDNDCPEFVTALVPRPPLPPKKKVCVNNVNIGLRDQFIYDRDCPDFITAMVPGSPRSCVNFGLNEELILPPLAPELPCGLGYLPGSLPVVAKAYAPCSKCCGCGCGCTPCSSAALPICSPYSCAALACPLSPDCSPYVKPVIL